MLQELSRRAGLPDASWKRQPIEALLFDFGGTLDANGIAWKERFYALYRAEGLDMSAEAFAPVFYAADDPLVGSLTPSTDLAGTVRALVVNLEAEFSRRGAVFNKGSRVDRGERVGAQFLADIAATIAGNEPVVTKLAERYRLGIVSNFYGNLEAVCCGAGLGSFFSVMVDSRCVGAEKPDPAIFQAALDALSTTAKTTVFVGDSLRRDREGARRMGMRFIWLTADGRTAAPGVDHTIADLRDLLAVLA